MVKYTGNLFAVFFFILVFNQQNLSTDIWLAQQSNSTQKLFKCFFTDSLKGWCVGDSGIILNTTNGGNIWSRQQTSLNHFVFDVSFINSLTGWCIASDLNVYPNPVLLKTTNGGANWQHYIMLDTNMLLFTCYFKNSLTGWLAGYNGVILKSTDGGINWVNVRDTSEFGWHSVWDISSENTQFAYSCGGTLDFAGVVSRSNQNGTGWSSQGIAPEPIFKLIYSDSLNGFGVGGDFEYGASTVRTTDGGNSWHYENIGFFGVPRSFAYRTPDELWMPLSFGGSWGVSTNGGFNWFQIPAANNASLNDICFTDSRNGWAVGDNGVILKYNSNAIGILNYSGTLNEFELYQNYPNPFNNSTIIEFYVSKISRVILTLYDASGKLIKIIFDDFMQPGKRKIQFNADNISSGIYFYKITAGSGSSAKKLVIVK